MKRILSAILVLSFAISLVGCAYMGYDEPQRKIPNAPTVDIEVTPTEKTASSPEEAITDISVDVLKSLYKGDENTLISAVSISLALGLTAGGAEGETLREFEELLGRGVSLEEMNAFYKALSEKIDDAESVDINVANSIWIRDNKDAISVNDGFIRRAEENFDADVYSRPFDDSTAKDINAWVDDNTDGMIKGIIDKIDPLTVMYLINALAFEADWQREYTDTSDYFKFTNCTGDVETVTGMFSREAIYLEDENTVGFVKNYKGGDYGFAVFLPNKDVSINDYVTDLTGEKLISMLNNTQTVPVEAKLPKFSFSYSASLNDTLKAMGLETAFDSSQADLSGIGSSAMGNLYISEVLHKTFIEVAEEGTRAAAVTSVALNTESAMMMPENVKYVTVDRPFVFAIIDNASNTPLFMGVVLSVE